MSLLTVSLLIDVLILLVNSPALVKNEKKPFVLVQTGRVRMDVWVPGVGRCSRRLLIGQRLLGHAHRGRGRGGAPCAVGGGCSRGLNSQSARVCLQLFMREVGRVRARV
jgi:hypothetical protein